MALRLPWECWRDPIAGERDQLLPRAELQPGPLIAGMAAMQEEWHLPHHPAFSLPEAPFWLELMGDQLAKGKVVC